MEILNTNNDYVSEADSILNVHEAENGIVEILKPLVSSITGE